MKKILLIGLLLGLFSDINAQSTPCYTALRSEGIALARKKSYSEANNRFWAALITCTDRPADHDLEALIKDVQRSWISDLESARDQAEKSYREAVAARAMAEKARDAEAVAKVEAERNAILAKQRGLQAETNRLALLSNVVRERGAKSDAVLLAFLALNLSGAETSSFVRRAFSEAVRDSFARPVFKANAPVTNLQYLGNTLLIQTQDRQLLTANNATSSLTGSLLASNVLGVALPNNGNQPLVWLDNATPRLLRPDNQEAGLSLAGHTGRVRCAAFANSRPLVVTGSRDYTARIWDDAAKVVAVLKGHSGHVQQVAFSSDDAFLLTRAGGTVRLWTAAGDSLGQIGGDERFVSMATFVPGTSNIVAFLADGQVALFQNNGQLLRTLSKTTARADLWVFHPESAAFFVATEAKQITAFDKKGEVLARFEHPVAVQGLVPMTTGGLLTWGTDHVVRLWNSKGEIVQTLRGHRNTLTGVETEPRTGLLLTTAKDGTAKLWDKSGVLLFDWSLATDTPARARFSPDGTAIVAAERGGKIVTNTPIPDAIFQQMKDADLLGSEQMKYIIKKYNIQLFDTLLGK